MTIFPHNLFFRHPLDFCLFHSYQQDQLHQVNKNRHFKVFYMLQTQNRHDIEHIVGIKAQQSFLSSPLSETMKQWQAGTEARVERQAKSRKIPAQHLY